MSIEETNIVEPGDISDINKVEFKNVDQYIDYFSELVNLEREEEMRRHKNEIRKLSGKEREKRGRAVLHLKPRNEGTALGGRSLVKFVRKSGLPETEISVGDLVRVSNKNPLSDNNPSGTVLEKTGYSILVAFDNKLPGWVKGSVRLDLYVNDITFQRMLDSLNKIRELEGRRKKLFKRIISYNEIEKEKTDFDKSIDLFNCKLNKSQEEAVLQALSSDFFHLIHGPPGTGKTVTCVELIEQVIENGKEVLACADSNTAVDNLVEHLVKQGRYVVRVGHPARITPILREHSLDFLLEDNEFFKKACSLREKAYKLKDQQDNFTYPSGRWRRGLSNKAIKDLADKNRGSRGIPPKRIKEMAKCIQLQEKIDEIFNKIDSLEEKAVRDIVDNADVVCSTTSSSASEALKDFEFDICVIDEATQAVEPSCLIPMVKCDKVVMAGDHKQLPPTILNEEANKEGLSDTLFERLLALYGDEVKSLLTVQYRMNEKIMEFSDQCFYDGKLSADESVKTHTLQELVENEVKGGEYIEKVLDPGVCLCWIDHKGDFSEKSRSDSPSKVNPGEAEIIDKLVSGLTKMGISPRMIGIITPYNDQKDLLKRLIKNEEIEIDTVDGFQGREKEVILLSLVRSNLDNSVGFLKDLRRLNVSITRARKKLVVVADSTTVCRDKTYSRFYDHVSKNGVVVTK
ncbi:MAG: IGHMBP2 family helicase [Candidatus Thermoplasmatota archaeon]